jgi:hypothetical protein
MLLSAALLTAASASGLAVANLTKSILCICEQSFVFLVVDGKERCLTSDVVSGLQIPFGLRLASNAFSSIPW